MQFADNLDKKISSIFHSTDSKIVTTLLYSFARIFNPAWIIIPICIIGLFSFLSGAYQNYRDSFMYTIFYAGIGIEFNLFITLGTKKLFGRIRPHFDEEKIKNKPRTFRAREINCSMPSGDAMQCANFIIAFSQILIRASIIDCNIILLLIFFQILVSFGRVYFMCHYLGDVLIGTCLGIANASLLYYVLFPIFQKFSNSIL